MRDICPICRGTATQNTQYCKIHHRAYLSLESAFKKWRLAYADEIEKKAFLERILQLAETGVKVREVAMFLLRKDLS